MNNVLSGLAFNDEVRFYIADTKEMVNEMNTLQMCTPVCAAALGRTASITGLMGLMLKEDQEVTAKLIGDGPAGTITAIANAVGEVRATIENPFVDLPLKANNKLDVAGAVGTSGTLQVIKNLHLKEPFVGQSEIISGEIAEDFTYYFALSEQIPTAISAGVLVDVDHSIKQAGAFIVQLLPNAGEETIDKLEKAFLELGQLTTCLEQMSITEIVSSVFGDDFKILEQKSMKFLCTCSEERYINAIRMLGTDEIKEIKQDPIIECTCGFCKSVYLIDQTKI